MSSDRSLLTGSRPLSFPPSLSASSGSVDDRASPETNALSLTSHTDLTKLLATISPLLKPASKKIHWKDKVVEKKTEFERDDEEIIRMFSDFILNIPQAPTHRDAEIYLEELRANPNLSFYIPKDSDLSAEKILSLVYKEVKQTPMSATACSFAELYLIDLFERKPEIIEIALDLIELNNDTNTVLLSLEDVESNEKAFVHAWLTFKQQNRFPIFINALIELIPLEVVAKFKKDAALVELARSFNNCFSEEQQLTYAAPKMILDLEAYIQIIKSWVRERKDELRTFKTLTLINSQATTLPEEFISSLDGVNTVSFHRSFIPPSPTLLMDVVKLPNLEHLDFSYANLPPESTNWILDAIQNAPNLKSLNLSRTAIHFNAADSLIDFCTENEIDLHLNVFSQDEIDHLIMLDRINMDFRNEILDKPPSSSLLHPEAFIHFIESTLKEWGKHLHIIEVLNLSGSSICSIPEEYITHLSGVKEIDLRQTYSTTPESYRIWHTMFISLAKIKKLETLNLQENHLDADSLNLLLPCLKELKNLKKLNLLDNPFTREEVPALVKYCKENEIELLTPISRCERDRNTLLTHLSSTGKTLDQVTSLDISGVEIESIPEDIIPLLSGVESVTFSDSKIPLDKTVKVIRALLKLPNLNAVNFSNNLLDDDALKELFPAFQRAVNLKSVNLVDTLTQNPFNLRNVPELASHFSLNKIQLTRSMQGSELGFLQLLQQLNNISASINIPIPSVFMDAQDLYEKVLPSLEAHKESLQEHEFLDLSKVPLEILPQGVLQYISHIKVLRLAGSFSQMTKNYSAFTQLIQLPHLEKLDLSSTLLKPSMIANLSDLVRSPEHHLQEIDLTNCSFFQESYQKFIELCFENGIVVIRGDDFDDMH